MVLIKTTRIYMTITMELLDGTVPDPLSMMQMKMSVFHQLLWKEMTAANQAAQSEDHSSLPWRN